MPLSSVAIVALAYPRFLGLSRFASICLLAYRHFSIAMPKYHVVVGACNMEDGSTGLLSTIRPSTVATYTWPVPIGAFEWPMDSMTRQPGQQELDYDGTLAYLQGTGRYYWIARIYKSYTGLLDMYIRFD